jgi:hypothetical protein
MSKTRAACCGLQCKGKKATIRGAEVINKRRIMDLIAETTNHELKRNLTIAF